LIVVDSSVWIDYLNEVGSRQTDRLDHLLGSGSILVGDLILCEILQGFRTEAEAQRTEAAMSSFEFASMVGREVAVRSAADYRALRRRGITVRRTVELLIAEFCILNGHSLLHADRDFDVFERELGLRIV
jgi:hypothetical protein